ncbi:MAG: hypothetical protein F6J94_11815 [Moorea sp. SIO1F2]|uniref:hypothetical protein n=2 Tax=unclassified Moorena TaxID=2683338 RepID=UPI0013BCEFDE|nr:hypothetical protein [Moorena sp. SIO1F2]NET82590.1 hypothetical protein [Moorena sp. SIO1F2]
MGILPARKLKRARCPFHQDARSTKMPVSPRCPFHQDARILPARKLKRARCPFHQDARSTKMSMARQDARSTKMPMARQDAHGTARCPWHSQMPMARQDTHGTKLLKSSRIYSTTKFVHHLFLNRYIALCIKVRTLIKAEKLMHVNFEVRPVANLIIRCGKRTFAFCLLPLALPVALYRDPCRNCDNFCSLLPTPYSLLPVPCSLFPVPCYITDYSANPPSQNCYYKIQHIS